MADTANPGVCEFHQPHYIRLTYPLPQRISVVYPSQRESGIREANLILSGERCRCDTRGSAEHG